jgi:hypothetical protein
MSEYREFWDAADVFAACCPKAKHFDGDCAAANRLYPILEKIRERAVSAADDPRDATIHELLALCGEAYRFICRTSSAPYSVCGHPRSDEYAEIELKLKAAAQALEETAQRIRKEIKG